jgi:hypothetical protein
MTELLVQDASVVERSCCCSSRPAVLILVDDVDLYLCGHHFRASQSTLDRLGAGVSYLGELV